MKSYREVVEQRYNSREKDLSVYNSMYSELNSSGFYMAQQVRKTCGIAFNVFKEFGLDLSRARILDTGCGKGKITRYIAELTESPENIEGFDLSEYRLEQAKRLNPGIKYFLDDIVKMDHVNGTYDVILAFDVFMHLSSEQQILEALKNIHDRLNKNGFFVWYDVLAEDHFKCADNAEYCGFSPRQMESYPAQIGFRKILAIPVFKYLFNQANLHTGYLGTQYPLWLLELIEKELAGTPGNQALIFQK